MVGQQRVKAWLVTSGLLAVAAQACADNQGRCERNGSCVRGALASAGIEPGGDGGAAGAPGSTPGSPCGGDPTCDDGNACTADACVAGECQRTALDDWAVVASLECQVITCLGGVETMVPLDATTLCDGDRVCDGSGSCVACDPSDPSRACPGGLACSESGACALPLGADCDDGGDCASGTCVDGVCCAVSCDGICMSCDAAQEYASCRFTAPYQNHDDCMEGSACDGAGQCKLLNGELCVQDNQCVSHHCDSGLCAPS